VHDEYRLVQPHGTIALDSAGNYSFTILLQASRNGNDDDGRRYTIRVTATATSVTAPNTIVADFVRRRVAVIVAVGNSAPGIRAAQAASSTIPIVFIFGDDPVKFELVPNLNRPGGNSTGVANLLRELARQWLPEEILRRVKRPYRAPIHRSFFNDTPLTICASCSRRNG